MLNPEKVFVDPPVMTVADFLQIPPVTGKLIYSQFFDKDGMRHLLGLQL